VNKNYLLLLLFFTANLAQAQKLKKEDKQLVNNLQQHIRYLADDKLEGRRTGTNGENWHRNISAMNLKKPVFFQKVLLNITSLLK
jgi:aminopeptidase YwaD